MKVTAPPASGVRHHWADLPDSVRSAVEDILGARVVHAQSQSGGQARTAHAVAAGR
ncbi:hypothetical protein [Streptomyces sp. NRRL S-1824]|uniref:hypothetical protein n=1 Tax=Streptomyces sp. NRRL S-1824 TaxID=1463889 RepID=UPI00131BA13D|nr:hypothetical protein [Streptomyces sp. NRRL S-1824]